jgi:hypothetical protein
LFKQTQKYGLDTFSGVFIFLLCGMVIGLITLGVEWIVYKYGVPYFKQKNWLKWLCFSQVSFV